ncbi:unnamed protein product [Orchesella dallaii]|uniref:Tyrosine-protein kinase receptor n=1 Tax=Orchesella dallaii TaxID=48710 RepID=A0ABP1QAD4_9HEXA
MARSKEERTGDPSCKLIRTGNKRIQQRRCLTSKLHFLLVTPVCLIFCLVQTAAGLDTSLCTSPLGMESGDIPDTDLTASSSFEMGNVGPQNGRVRVEKQGGAWCPKNQITSEAEEWIQIELHSVHVISAIETQGRFGNGHGQEFAEAFVVSYWRPELNKWVRYRDITGNEIIKGNINTYLAAKRELNPPIIGSKIRVLPYSYHRRTVCMRVEIYGCQLRGGLLSYSVQQGSKRGENWNFYDHTYDGIWEGNYLTKGLGTLFDGREGPSNFKDDYYGHERGKGWIGWKNDTRNSTSPIEIMFKFDSVREFNSVRIHTSNQFTKEVQVFSVAKVFFSIGGKFYHGDPVVYKHKEDCIFEDPQYISIKIPQRVGQYVKIQLFWATKWMLISEVTFDSQPAMGNFTEEVAQTHSTVATITPVEDVAQSQSDASESSSGGNRIPQEMINHMIGQTPTLHEEWSTVTIVITAVISSFVAIILVLLLILTAMVFRQKMKSHGEIPGSRNGMPLHYGEHHLEFGYATPEDIRKAKIATNVEYQEPFAEPQYPDFPGSVNAMSAVIENSSDSGVNISGKGSLTQYYSCTLVSNPTPASTQDSANEYEYAVPNELGKLLPNQLSPLKSIPNSPATMNRTCSRNVKQRFRELGVPEIPKHRLRMLRKLGNGAFGTVYIGELENSSKATKNLVAVKQLLKNATEKDKMDFLEEVRLLSSLTDPNVTHVLGVCCETEPHSVVLEFLELGDLCQFLRQNDTLLPTSNKKLSLSNLLHIGSQIASGMKFLEARNIVHRDLATRNCVVGKGLVVKISHFATDTDLYSCDYYRLDGKMPLPIRWMGWESLFMGKYSTKSDIWSFGVTLWEIFSYSRHSPYPTMSNQEVIHNLRRLSVLEESDLFEPLSKPNNCPRDVYQLMCDTWRRNDEDRPTFWEIHSFLTRKILQCTPYLNKGGSRVTAAAAVTAITGPSGSSSLVEHYIV